VQARKDGVTVQSALLLEEPDLPLIVAAYKADDDGLFLPALHAVHGPDLEMGPVYGSQ
jgi:hypothetical protein